MEATHEAPVSWGIAVLRAPFERWKMDVRGSAITQPSVGVVNVEVPSLRQEVHAQQCEVSMRMLEENTVEPWQ